MNDNYKIQEPYSLTLCLDDPRINIGITDPANGEILPKNLAKTLMVEYPQNLNT